MSQYRQTGFNAALTGNVREIANELEIDPTFPEKKEFEKRSRYLTMKLVTRLWQMPKNPFVSTVLIEYLTVHFLRVTPGLNS